MNIVHAFVCARIDTVGVLHCIFNSFSPKNTCIRMSALLMPFRKTEFYCFRFQLKSVSVSFKNDLSTQRCILVLSAWVGFVSVT